MAKSRWLALILAVAVATGFVYYVTREGPEDAVKFAQSALSQASAKRVPPRSQEPGAVEHVSRSVVEPAQRQELEGKRRARYSQPVVAMFESPAPTARDFFAAYRDELCECADRECVSTTVTRYAAKMAAVVWGDPALTKELISDAKACQERAWGTDYVPTDEERRMEFQAFEDAREEEKVEMVEAASTEQGATPNVAVGAGP